MVDHLSLSSLLCSTSPSNHNIRYVSHVYNPSKCRIAQSTEGVVGLKDYDGTFSQLQYYFNVHMGKQ